MKQDPEDVRQVLSACSECGLCQESCDLLTEIGDSPAAISERDATVEEAYACSLCGRCRAACPLGLDPGALFADRRVRAAARQEIDAEEYAYLFPDRAGSGIRIYRDYFGIDYQDLTCDADSEVGFFPGCTLFAYSPRLTRAIYLRLHENGGCRVLIDDCCGKPLVQMGLKERAGQALSGLLDKVRESGVKKLVMACSGCYYALREPLKEIGVEALTVYEALRFEPVAAVNLPAVTVHDSCPDRDEGIFARQSREALIRRGYALVEMEENRENAPCCGSGGQVTHFRPDRAELLVENRLKAAEGIGANILAAYCLSCVLNFARRPSALKVKHVLNLLLDCDEDYARVKDRAAEAFGVVEEEEV